MSAALTGALTAAVRRWWLREGVDLEVVDVAAVARQPWAQRWTAAELVEAICQRLDWILLDGDCPRGECRGARADPTARRQEELPCLDCAGRHWFGAPQWRGPRVVYGDAEHCPACMASLDADSADCSTCGHQPRGESLERALRLSTSEGANDGTHNSSQ